MAPVDTNNSVESRLRAIEDRLEIYNLIASHPPSADTGADYYTSAVYTEDGTFDRGEDLDDNRGHDSGPGGSIQLPGNQYG